MVKGSIKFVLLSLAFFLTTCAPGEFGKNIEKAARDPIDWKGDLTRDDVREALRPERQKAKERTGIEENAPIPPLASTVLAPDAPEINSSKKISLAITETIDLKDVLQELARLAELELALDPNISGGIILSVQNRNVGEVLEMVADLADLKYTIDNGVLKVVRDHPYLVHYNVDYLNLVRSSKGTIDTKTSTGSSSSGSGGSSSSSSSSSSGSSSGSASSGSITSGSSNSISSEYDGDLWTAVEKNIESIVEAASASIKKDTGTAAADDEDSDATTSTGDGSSYSVNKQAGIISVMTTFRKHKSIEKFLDIVMNSSSSQVLIEAKIIEVKLREDYATGINWSKLASETFSLSPVHQVTTTADKLPTGVLAGTVAADRLNFFKPNKANSVSGFMEFLQGFGITRTLSNPRVTIVNNQQAVLTFATNQPYFSITATPTTTTSTGGANATTTSSTFTTTLNTVPLGVILAIQPSINLETQEVTLHVRPTLTSKLGDIKDPSIKLNAPRSSTGVIITDLPDNNIPIVQVRELDTVLKARSGDVMIIGGIIQHSDESGDIGVPFLQEVPFFGNLAKQVGKTSNITETVILMQATIVPARSNYHKQDKKIYETFTQDPRPLVF